MITVSRSASIPVPGSMRKTDTLLALLFATYASDEGFEEPHAREKRNGIAEPSRKTCFIASSASCNMADISSLPRRTAGA